MDVEVERRRHKRSREALDVRCASFGLDEIFVSEDVSGGGLFLKTPSPLATGSDVELSFNLSPEGPEIKCSGRVVHSIPGVGMGIRFFDARGEVEMAINAQKGLQD
jgi:PilZ domain